MLSVGRQLRDHDPDGPLNEEGLQDLGTIKLLDSVADRGRENYMGHNVFDDPAVDGPPLNCNACHFNGGGNTNPDFPFPAGVTPSLDGDTGPSHNRSFGPRVEELIDQAPDVIVEAVNDPSVTNPHDDGFGTGTSLFNAPPVIESIDNPPFFHGHQINTVEGAVAFYASTRHLRDGEVLPPIVPLNGAQVINVARFMRVMGADFNAKSAITLLKKARKFRSSQKAFKRTNIKLAIAEIKDAVELLVAVQLHFADAVPLLREARRTLEDALRSTNNIRLKGAIRILKRARRAMINRRLSQPA